MPSALASTASRTSRLASAPIRDRASSSSAASGSGSEGIRCTAARGAVQAATPGGSGRLVARTSRRRPAASRARSRVRRSEVGSAQCRSSRTSTAGAVATRRDTTERQAANVARWSSPGLIRPSAAPGGRPIMRASSGNTSSPARAARTRSRAGRTTARAGRGSRPPSWPAAAGTGRTGWTRRRRRSAPPATRIPRRRAAAALLHQAGLAEPGLAGHQHDRAVAAHRLAQGRAERRQLGLPAHQRAAPAGPGPAARGPGPGLAQVGRGQRGRAGRHAGWRPR